MPWKSFHHAKTVHSALEKCLTGFVPFFCSLATMRIFTSHTLHTHLHTHTLAHGWGSVGMGDHEMFTQRCSSVLVWVGSLCFCFLFSTSGPATQIDASLRRYVMACKAPSDKGYFSRSLDL